jgi:predicted metal-dependent hydrolase
MQLELTFLIEAPEAPAGARVRRMTLGGRQIPYVFRRAPRRTIGIAVDERGLTAAAPRWVGVSEVEAFMREKESWILERLTEHAAHAPAKFQWREGSLLPYLGCAVALMFSGRIDAPRLRAGRLELPASKAGVPVQLREMTLAWLKIQALSLYRDRAAHLAEHGGVAVPLVQLSNARTQWGSCTADGRVRLHWRLVHFALPYIDYVIAHELAHLVELNHSRAFWRVVETMFPEYKAARAHLRVHGHLIPRL